MLVSVKKYHKQMCLDPTLWYLAPTTFMEPVATPPRLVGAVSVKVATGRIVESVQLA